MEILTYLYNSQSTTVVEAGESKEIVDSQVKCSLRNSASPAVGRKLQNCRILVLFIRKEGSAKVAYFGMFDDWSTTLLRPPIVSLVLASINRALVNFTDA